MLRILKISLCVALVVAASASVRAFSLLGPFEEWQTEALGYQGRLAQSAIGGPKNIGEEYRINLPTVHYAFDQSFLDFFGQRGVDAVESAIAIFNDLNSISSYGASLQEFPLEGRRINERARTLGLLDLKTEVMNVLLEQMGLADSTRYVWTSRTRQLLPGGSCPEFFYQIIQRNFDPVTWDPTPYVNGTLYTYSIFIDCDEDDSIALTFPADPLALSSTRPLTSFSTFGEYFTGLTRDDVAGLRYLYRSSNYNVENVIPPSTVIAGGTTNFNALQLLSTLDLAQFTADASTLPAEELEGLYPGLLITGSTPVFTNIVTTNLTAFFTNRPGAPVGAPPQLVVETNFVTNVVVQFQHTFANVVTNVYLTNGFVTIQETNVVVPVGAPVGSPLRTNIISTTVLSNFVHGDFYIVPPELCGYHIIRGQLTNRVFVTNTVETPPFPPDPTEPDPTEPEPGPEPPDPQGQSFVRHYIRSWEQHHFVVAPIECPEEVGSALRPGVEKVTFVRADYDSKLGALFGPITNRYVSTFVTNGLPVQQTFERVITEPDLLFRAEDITTPEAHWVLNRTNTEGWDNSNAPAGLGGPGVITPQITVTFNKVGPVFVNTFPFFLEQNAVRSWSWASFDGTTNAPVIFPIGSSITELEEQVLGFRITTTNPVNARAGHFYHFEFRASGGVQPHTWSVVPGHTLPAGLSLASNGVLFGTPLASLLTGSPPEPRTFQFVLRVTDLDGVTIEKVFSLTITP